MADASLVTGHSRAGAAVAPVTGMLYRPAALADPVGNMAMGCATLLLIPPGSYGTASALNPSVFSTQYVNAMALDINISSSTGGTSPTISFTLERLNPDGTWGNVLSTLVGPLPPVQFSIDVGPFSIGYGGLNTAQHEVFSQTSRIRWTTSQPSTFTFSVSAIGRGDRKGSLVWGA